MSACVRVYMPTKNAMQSGRSKSGTWIVEFINPQASYKEPLMGWQGTSASFARKRLSFQTKEEALIFVRAKKLSYTLEEPKKENLSGKQYGHHFRPGKIL
jgi:hypothetical protein